MLTFLGKKNIAAAIPILATLAAAFDLAGLQGEIAALLTLTVNFVPPSIVGILSIIGALQAAISLGLQPPALTIQGDLVIKLGLLQAKLDLLLEITQLLLAAGVHAYSYEGTAQGLGQSASSEFNPGPTQGGIAGGENIFGILLVVEANASVTVSAMKRVFIA